MFEISWKIQLSIKSIMNFCWISINISEDSWNGISHLIESETCEKRCKISQGFHNFWKLSRQRTEICSISTSPTGLKSHVFLYNLFPNWSDRIRRIRMSIYWLFLFFSFPSCFFFAWNDLKKFILHPQIVVCTLELI